jgi:hypothetical protein
MNKDTPVCVQVETEHPSERMNKDTPVCVQVETEHPSDILIF